VSNKSLKIAPSMLAADCAHFGDEITRITEAGADYIHIDVMDGHFVPNLTFGPPIIKTLKKYSNLPFDVHLMIEPADPFINAFVDAGADILTVHVEACPHLHRTLQTIKAHNIKAGVALNPATPISSIRPILDMLDLVLIMTVNPGFGGQNFIESGLSKIVEARKMIDKSGYNVEIEVDGGVNLTTAPKIINAGADVLVAGTAIFNSPNKAYSGIIEKIKNIS
jgi:ribulose-phosphate 3-epimerase